MEIFCLKGYSSGREVLLGFASSKLLNQLSFADVLDEDTKRGYQRKFNYKHSQDFRRYITKHNSTTIPLTLNLRPEQSGLWKIKILDKHSCLLKIDLKATNDMRIFSQVDCQHRLGYLDDLDIELPFMSFINLSIVEEMEIFKIINGKAKGLNTSLLDFHDAQLSKDLENERPELFIALFLNNEISSPWFRQLDLGGTSTSGLFRRASLRTMQKAVKRFLLKTKILDKFTAEEVAQIVLNFWIAVSETLPNEWHNHRKNILNKGIGVYSLMDLLSDLIKESKSSNLLEKKTYVKFLIEFVDNVNWSTNGIFKGLGGEGGVEEVTKILRDIRRRSRLKVI